MDSGGSSSGGSHNVIPESVMEAVRRTSRNVEDVEANLEEFLSYCDTETLYHLEHLERANVLLMIAKANTTLFALRLRCKGVDPDDHSIKREFERLSLYEEKLKQCMDLNKGHSRMWLICPDAFQVAAVQRGTRQGVPWRKAPVAIT
ncbi:uncharacterized protein [Primulina eburnea]|uniref:uncharacterized protein isoform X2 n=1 Tax=Primulina eburnea TaxID=1245227 RepID=UPI003C6CA410